MNKIIRYKIIQTNSIRAMVYEVGISLDQEWIPQGGISTLPFLNDDESHPTQFFQAMIKKNKNE